jgi:hypothetical protein
LAAPMANFSTNGRTSHFAITASKLVPSTTSLSHCVSQFCV